MKASKHWLLQRLSALAILPAGVFTIYKIAMILSSHESFFDLLSSPFSLLCVILFIGFSFYHAQLGWEIILEDYINNSQTRFITNTIIKFVNIVTFIFFLLAVIIGY